MGRSLVVATLALVGLLCAAGMGIAAYVVSRDSVAVPVTQLQPAPQQLTPAHVRRVVRTHSRPIEHTPTATRTVAPPTTTVDDHGGRGGSDNSGRGGGHGGDD
jgi:hypothetical protein